MSSPSKFHARRKTFTGSRMRLFNCTYFNKSAIAGTGLELPCPSITVFPALQHPRTRGRVTLRSADPDVPAVINLHYLADPEDLRRMAQGVRIAWRLMNSARFAPYIRDFASITPEVAISDSAATDFIRENCTSIFHPVGTAKMGPDADEEALVDQFCRVRGVKGLHVVDASVMSFQ
jgi:choline dehydrogenase